MHVEVEGTRLFVDVLGSALVPDGPRMRARPTLVLLHGGPGMDHTIFRPTHDALADVAQLVYVDQRGQGRSDPAAPEQWNLARWGDDVRALCESLGIERPIVYGHSFGGMAAMAYATRHPEHPAGLVLSCTYARQDVERTARRVTELGGAEAGEAARAMWTRPGADTRDAYNRLVLPLYMRRPLVAEDLQAIGRIRENGELGLHFAQGEMQRFDFLADLAEVRCPTLVIGAEQDPVCPIEDQLDLHAALPEDLRRLERFADASHMLWEDYPERYFAVLRSFVRDVAFA